MKVNDGGPAFPVPRYVDRDGPIEGMSLRDYFAAQALSAALVGATGLGTLPAAQRHTLFAEMARLTYEAADAMLAARAKDAAQ